jgi:hypothetical protein
VLSPGSLSAIRPVLGDSLASHLLARCGSVVCSISTDAAARVARLRLLIHQGMWSPPYPPFTTSRQHFARQPFVPSAYRSEICESRLRHSPECKRLTCLDLQRVVLGVVGQTQTGTVKGITNGWTHRNLSDKSTGR